MAKGKGGGKAKTGTRPTGNSQGHQGSGHAPANPKGMTAKAVGGIEAMAKGKGPSFDNKSR